MTFILWAGDDDSSSAQILFDNNIPFAFSAEDVAVIGDVSIDYISKLRTDRLVYLDRFALKNA